MKLQIFRLLFAAIILSSLHFGCSNKVDVIGQWKEIPIVYGIFTPVPEDGLNYFRIEKAFLDPSTDAYQIAQRPDSLYYGANDLLVLLYERTGQTAYRVVDTLERVDANTLGTVRDSGIFAQSPNYIYVTNATVDANDTERFYKLEIRNLVNGKTFTQYCRAVKPGNYDLTDSTFLDFRMTLPASSRPIRWSHYDATSSAWVFDDVKFNWLQPFNAAIYDLSVIFKYAEFEVDANDVEISGTRVYKEVSWKPIRNFIAQGSTALSNPFNNGESFYLFTKDDGSSVAQELNGENFYKYLVTKISNVTGSNIRRCATKIDVRVDAAGPELAQYISARNANQNLIGGLFPADPFTNIEDGYGIFSYKIHTFKRNYNIDAAVFDYLHDSNSITKDLGFRDYGCN